MTQEDKELLLKDLCARLPYGVICNIGLEYPLPLQRIFVDRLDGILLDFYEDGNDYQYYLCEVKPYLRPLASMTEEERDRLRSLDGFIRIDIQNGIVEGSYDVFDYLNSIHVSYRTINGKDMFELGLALVAPEGMYEY